MRARSLRANSTDAETLLWLRLRNRQFLGLKFRRQHPVGPYFSDFACLEIGLVVELDGGQHIEDAALAYDQRRLDEMATFGFQTVRFWNTDVLKDLDAVLESLRQTVATLTPTLSRERERG